ncbi:hypothetical protein OSB04_008384 [Centaurea solstitialis]|uniref:Receptor-like serine/threonine-protein kinase n=1 Tax=Centaurea solstitialis TaxID=347529 RepID=A0AA38WT45_9ASTR|nr:hypothetical protein OSB04_008384 [Centaurea solstitialis]
MEEISRSITTILLLLLVSLQIQKTYNAEMNIITDSLFLTEKDTLVSPAEVFELGYFRPDESNENRYLGIWYKKISVKTFVWVANRDFPLTGPPSHHLLKIASWTEPEGSIYTLNRASKKIGTVLVLMNNLTVVWSSNATTITTSPKATAVLLDTGNLVVIDEHRNNIWQSFDHPTDTTLPGMKFGKDFLTNKEWCLTSWRSNQDPSPGEFTWSVDTRGYPQDLLKQGTTVKFRGGPWNGLRFSGAPTLHRNTIYTYNVVINKTEVVFTYTLDNDSIISRLILNPTGVVQRFVWLEDENKWQILLELPIDICDSYNICGGYGSCSHVNTSTCVCLDGSRFVPRNPEGWERAEWSGGCVRGTALDCEDGSESSDGFVKYSYVKLPDTKTCWFDRSVKLKECEERCLKNCSCMAYANMDIRGEGSGCLLWFDDLMDLRVYFDGNGGQDIFVRMASSELDSGGQLVSKKKGGANIKIILPIVSLLLLASLIFAWFWYTWRKRHHAPMEEVGATLAACESQNNEAMELPLFSFSTIAKATADFSLNNKLGEGGFGPVYKGILEEGIEIAVKRLSATSSQGLDEFKNEVICISKLQHRNLVKLLGCSIQGEEKLLIYEYMPNKSLDRFIFDKKQRTMLDWTKRFNIIKGIARGLVYLHQDSRLRIIHRDLKASNILLDLDMNPKISDFGIARSFGGNETQANTERVVGTYGYMSPEYALDGVFSIKSDVFSFGVLTLEIVSGKRNRGFVHPEHDNNLIGHAWRMHNEGRSTELIDTSLAESNNTPFEVLRSIEVGLLCVQQSPEDRPNMAYVVMVLGGEGAMPKPKEPAFFTERNLLCVDFSSSTNPTNSTTGLTITEVVAR